VQRKEWVKGEGRYSRLAKRKKTLRLSWSRGARLAKVEKVELFISLVRSLLMLSGTCGVPQWHALARGRKDFRRSVFSIAPSRCGWSQGVCACGPLVRTDGRRGGEARRTLLRHAGMNAFIVRSVIFLETESRLWAYYCCCSSLCFTVGSPSAIEIIQGIRPMASCFLESPRSLAAGWLCFSDEIVYSGAQRTEGYDQLRAGARNRVVFSGWFAFLEKALARVSELSGGGAVTPNRIINLDEAGVNHNATGRYVVARRGATSTHRQTDASRVRHSFVATIAADGTAAPAFLIEPGQRKTTALTDYLVGCPPNWECTVSRNGYMTSSTMLEFARHLAKWETLANRPPHEWSLLILDGYNSHTVDPAVLQAFRDSRLHAVSLPSHTTAELQPCDNAVFAPLKAAIGQQMDSYRAEHEHPHVPLSEFARVLGRAWPHAMKKETIQNGFRYAA
jgi:hypothetical protein